MSDSTATSVGMAIAGIALVSAFLPWPTDPLVSVGGLDRPVLAVLAAIAVLAFFLRRHELVVRELGGSVAAVASVGILAYATAMLVLGGRVSTGTIVPVMAIVAGSFGTVAAYADVRRVPAETIRERARIVAVGIGVGVTGLVTGTIIPVIAIVGVTLVTDELSFPALFALSTAFFGVGLILVSVAFVRWTGRGLSYIDVHVPTLRDVGYAVGGVIALVGVAILVSIVYSILNVPTAENTIEQAARREGAEVLLYALPLAWLAIGLGEELVFRNVVQKYFAESFSVVIAIVVSSVIFTLVHIPAYFTADVFALSSTLAIVFALSLILGTTYARTGNLIVPVFIHGTYNAVVFVLMYVSITGGL